MCGLYTVGVPPFEGSLERSWCRVWRDSVPVQEPGEFWV